MSVISRSLVRNNCRNTWNVLFMNQKKYLSETIKEDCLRPKDKDVEIPEITLVEHILNNLGKYTTNIGLECGITQRRYTYDQILLKSTNLNKNLRKKLKLEKGDVVAFLLPNMPEFPIGLIGVLLAGLKITTINPLYTPGEIKRQLLDSGTKVIVTLPKLWPIIKKAITEGKLRVNVITIKIQNTDTTPAGAIDWSELVNPKADFPDAELTSLHDTIVMPYSSGTTGLPKGVRLTNYSLVANITQLHSPDFVITQVSAGTHQDVTIAVLPMFHIYAFTGTLCMLTDGVKIVTLPNFSPIGYMNCVKDYRPHVLLLVPPLVLFLNSFPGVKSEYFSSLRTIYCGGAPLGASDEDRMRKKVGRPISILQGYGLTETSPAVALIPHSRQGKYPGSIGTAIPNTYLKVVAIDDKEGKHLPPETTGELLIKGPQVMKGYHNQPEQSRDAFLKGWLKSGDLVRYNKDGMLYIADRIKELIKVNAFQVAPAELEQVLRDYPGVLEAAVIGIPHKLYGEVPRAYVVAKKDAIIDINKLDDYVTSKVAKHKRLHGRIVFVNEIPKNPSGKILRRKLKLKYLEDSGKDKDKK